MRSFEVRHRDGVKERGNGGATLRHGPAVPGCLRISEHGRVHGAAQHGDLILVELIGNPPELSTCIGYRNEAVSRERNDIRSSLPKCLGIKVAWSTLLKLHKEFDCVGAQETFNNYLLNQKIDWSAADRDVADPWRSGAVCA